METVIGTRPKEAFPPLLPPEHRSFLAPLESTPTRMSYAGNSTAGVLLVKHAQLLNVQGRGTEYQKGKGHRVSKEQIRCDLVCSREWPSAEDPRHDIFPSDCRGLLPRRLPPPCAPPPAHAAVTPPPTMAKLKPHSRPALPGIVSSQNFTNLGAITRNYPEWGWSALE